MKKFIFVSFLFGMISTLAMAQDDMYFTPTKKDKKEIKTYRQAQTSSVYRNVDEYNRRGKYHNQGSTFGSDSI